jgi:hypothetical protein
LDCSASSCMPHNQAPAGTRLGHLSPLCHDLTTRHARCAMLCRAALPPPPQKTTTKKHNRRCAGRVP